MTASAWMRGGCENRETGGSGMEQSGEGRAESTKERILQTALSLFARDGYEATSVSAIAGELGITKGALYRHYRNKHDILEHIVARMVQIDAERSRQFHVPELPTDVPQESLLSVTMREIRAFSLAQFDFWTGDAFAARFRRLLTLEQYRSGEMAQLHRSCLTSGPVAYMEGIFRAMAERGAIRADDPGTLALEFYAPLWLLICACDEPESRERGRALLKAHIDRFIRETSAEF